jgi:Bacterial Ig-like domain/Dockerin type I domain
MWLVEATGTAGPGSALNVMRIDNPFSPQALSQQTFSVAVDAYAAATTPRQPNGPLGGVNGSGQNFANLGTRMYFSGLRTVAGVTHLVTAQTVGVDTNSDGNPDGDSVRWYDLDLTNASSPSLIQQGSVNATPTNIDTYFPGADIAPDGTIGLNYSQSGPGASDFMSMYVTGRAPNNPPGVMQTPMLAHMNQANLNSSGRAGDYSFTSVDPSDGTFWAVNEYAANISAPNWSTWIQHFSIDRPNAPSTPALVPADNPNGDNLTNTHQPSFTGTGETGDTITLYDGSTVIGTGVVVNGTWTIQSTGLINLTHTITATQTNSIGNTSVASGALVIHVYLFADVNQDNHVDIADVSALQSALSNLSQYMADHSFTTEELLLVCDIDHDHAVTNLDVQALINWLAGGNGY